MAVSTVQRFVSGLDVFDTFNGLKGTIIELSFDSTAVPALAPLYTGRFFVVEFSDATRQVFTVSGTRINHSTGVTVSTPNDGVTLLTAKELSVVVGVGYPGPS